MEFQTNYGPQNNYGEIHRILLTYIRSVRFANHENVVNVLAKCLDTQSQEEAADKLTSYISTINTKISHHGFRIDRSRDHATGELYYIFINTIADEVAKTNTNFSTVELDAIKKVIEEIVESGLEYAVSSLFATQIVSNAIKKSLREASSLIQTCIEDGWFNRTLNDKLLLSIRTKSELKKYMIEKFGIRGKDIGGRILVCNQCNDVNTIGFKCPTDICSINFHAKCLSVYLNRSLVETEREGGNKGVQCPNQSCNYWWAINGSAQVLPLKIGVDQNTIIR